MPAKKTKILPFLGGSFAKTAAGAVVAVFGAPHGTPYPKIDNRKHEGAPDAIRSALQLDAEFFANWDWDLGGPVLGSGGGQIVDLGNLATKSKSGSANRKLIAAQTAAILAHGAVPLMIGGDDSTPIPFLSAFAQHRPITILQIDAHIDWRHERHGENMGFSSTMRRASEMPHVWRIVQAGARGVGSAREREVLEAQGWGAHFVTSRHIQDHGIQLVIDHIEPESDCVICLDLDALDSSIMPAVAAPSPGGLTYRHVTDLIAGVAAKARIAGFAMVEFVPKQDLTGTCAYTAARIAAHVVARVVRQKR